MWVKIQDKFTTTEFFKHGFISKKEMIMIINFFPNIVKPVLILRILLQNEVVEIGKLWTFIKGSS